MSEKLHASFEEYASKFKLGADTEYPASRIVAWDFWNAGIEFLQSDLSTLRQRAERAEADLREYRNLAETLMIAAHKASTLNQTEGQT